MMVMGEQDTGTCMYVGLIFGNRMCTCVTLVVHSIFVITGHVLLFKHKWRMI